MLSNLSFSQDNLERRIITPLQTTLFVPATGVQSSSNGWIGIGTSSPSYTLDIIGSVNASNFLVNGSILKNGVWDKTGNNVSYYGGFVGIGKSPNYTLDVAGTINATEILVNGQPISAGSGGTVNGIIEMSGKLGIALDDNSILSTTSLTDYKLFVGGGMIAEKVQN